MEKYESVTDDVFNIFSNSLSIVKKDDYRYNLCESCGSAMTIDPQRGTYTCSDCGSQVGLVGGIDDFAHGSSSIVRMSGSKSSIKHRNGKDTTDGIRKNYYGKFVKLNEEYVKKKIEITINKEKLLRTTEEENSSSQSAECSTLIDSRFADSRFADSRINEIDPEKQFYRDMAFTYGVDDSYLDLIEATCKTARIPNNILVNVARTYEEIFMYSRKREYDETGDLLETRESRNRGKKLWGLLAYLLVQECAKNKFPLDQEEAILFVEPQQKDVSVTKGERIARDLNTSGRLNLTQLNTSTGSKMIEKRLQILGIDESQYERFVGFVTDIMQTVCDEGVAIRTVEKTQIIGSIYIIIRQLGLKIDADTISTKCEIQTKTFTSFHDIVMENKVIFHHVFMRYRIPDGLEGKIVKRKK